MRKILVLLFLFIILLIISIFGVKVYTETNQKNINLISPIPDFLTISQNKQVSSLNIWLPNIFEYILGKPVAPEISAKSALVYDLTSKKMLFEKNPKQKLPMASLTKIMTAIIALENKKSDDKYQITKQDIVGENSMGLTEGETLSLKELLYGLILVSGNDAAEALATNFKGGRENFIRAMNLKASAMGLKDTNFTNPSGLEGDGDQYTTVYDLLVITKYALENLEEFKNVSQTAEINIEANQFHKQYYLFNETNLLTSYPGVKGVKTGYTPEAGLCLVTYLDYGGHKIIGVILGSDDRRGEMKELLDFSLDLLGITPPKHG